MPSNPELSALLVIGDSRPRAQRALDSLYAQSAAARMEVVIVDIASGDAPALVVSDRVPTRSVKLAPGTGWGDARIVAARTANSPIVAFIEDHCTAAAGWAEALIEALTASTWSTDIVPYGPTRFVNGQNQGGRAVGLQVQKGDIVVVHPTEFASAAAVFPKPRYN